MHQKIMREAASTGQPKERPTTAQIAELTAASKHSMGALPSSLRADVAQRIERAG